MSFVNHIWERSQSHPHADFSKTGASQTSIVTNRNFAKTKAKNRSAFTLLALLTSRNLKTKIRDNLGTSYCPVRTSETADKNAISDPKESGLTPLSTKASLLFCSFRLLN